MKGFGDKNIIFLFCLFYSNIKKWLTAISSDCVLG